MENSVPDQFLDTPVLIVGAGPAGATAAFCLAKEKQEYLLIDKHTFPRDKICGDALSGKVMSVLKRLDASLATQLQDQTKKFTPSYGVRFYAPNRKFIDVPFKRKTDTEPAPGFISKRIDFDNFLLNSIPPGYGTHLFNWELFSIETFEDHSICIFKNNGSQLKIKTKILICADGDRSIMSKKHFGTDTDKSFYCAGLRVYYKNVSQMHADNFIELHFLKEALPGYFWIFPLPEGGANIGLGMLSSVVAKNKVNLKKLLQEIIEKNPEIKKRFENAEAEETYKGWGLPLGGKKRVISGNGYMLCGDAALLIDPFTGEGISNAMISAEKAAEQVLRCLSQNRTDAVFMSTYDAAVYKRLWAELRLSRVMQKMVHFPWLFNLVVNKANKSKSLQSTLMCMFDDLEMRARLKSPLFYLKILFNR